MSSHSLDYYLEGLLNAGITDPNEQIYKYLSPVDPVALKQIVDQLNTERDSKTTLTGKAKSSWTSAKNKRVGTLFEQLIKEIFKNSNVFDVTVNVHSTTGEIDFRLAFKPLSNKIPFLVSRTHIVGEAKCYDNSPKSEWVTEMIGNLELHATDMGMIFLYCTPRKLGREFRQAVGMGVAARKFIIPLGRFHIQELLNGKQLLGLLSDQYTKTATHSTELEV